MRIYSIKIVPDCAPYDDGQWIVLPSPVVSPDSGPGWFGRAMMAVEPFIPDGEHVVQFNCGDDKL